ncbi:DoxX family protein [Mucilaginibacter flavidus]|uniref:DoxX family protein n=1 Tax=Mucilaginibacter flavidus TaxID=2949309 RepID=UPI0020928292|nr:DoxX family protein [Mucilaginibacter flavidus]MCO5949353.1 DoxX family protein [Mucilaginibacter flavidus]
MKNILKLSFLPINNDVALLFIRIWFCTSIFVKHGIEKFTRFPQMVTHFPDPIHVGPTIGLSFALVADAICTLFIIFGLGTRVAALFMMINLLIVFILLHQFSFIKEHAELVYTYLGLSVFIIIAGPGKFSLDNKLLN